MKQQQQSKTEPQQFKKKKKKKGGKVLDSRVSENVRSLSSGPRGQMWFQRSAGPIQRPHSERHCINTLNSHKCPKRYLLFLF